MEKPIKEYYIEMIQCGNPLWLKEQIIENIVNDYELDAEEEAYLRDHAPDKCELTICSNQY